MTDTQYPEGFEGGGDGKAYRLFGAALIGHNKIGAKGIETAVDTFGRGVKRLEVDGDIHPVHLHAVPPFGVLTGLSALRPCAVDGVEHGPSALGAEDAFADRKDVFHAFVPLVGVDQEVGLQQYAVVDAVDRIDRVVMADQPCRTILGGPGHIYILKKGQRQRGALLLLKDAGGFAVFFATSFIRYKLLLPFSERSAATKP